MAIAATVKAFLDKRGVQYGLVAHPPSLSSRETATAAHVREDHIAKAVVVKDSDGFLLVVIPGNHWVKLHALCEELGCALEMATEDELRALFSDCEPGAIPPLGAAYGLRTVWDEALAMLADIYFEAGDHRQLLHLRGEAFRGLFCGARHGYFSHPD